MSQLPRNLTDAERRSIADALRGMAAIRRMTAAETSKLGTIQNAIAEADELEQLASEVVRPGTRLVLERLP